MHDKLAILLVMFLAAAGPVATVDAQDDAPVEPPTPAAETVAEEWTPPPAPRSDDFDWIQFTNGEWLKGEIKDLQDEGFEFESDELDQLSIDWADIAVLHSSRPNTIVFTDRSSVEGKVAVEGSVVTITTADGETLTYPRGFVRGIIPGKQTELNYWSGKITFGATVRSGNVNQTDVSLFARLQRRAPGTRLSMEYNGAYGELEGEVTAQNNRFVLTNDMYLSRRFFVTLPTFTAYSDEFQNIDYQLTPGVLAGYDIVDTARYEWSVSAGVGYQYTRFLDVAPLADSSADDTVFLAGTSFEWEITKDIDFEFGFDMSIPLSSADSGTYHANTALEFDLWGDFDFDVRVIWDRQGTSATASATSTQADDVRVQIGIGYEF